MNCWFPSPIGVITSITDYQIALICRLKFPSPIGVITSITASERLHNETGVEPFPSPIGVITSITINRFFPRWCTENRFRPLSGLLLL